MSINIKSNNTTHPCVSFPSLIAITEDIITKLLFATASNLTVSFPKEFFNGSVICFESNL